jgi:hypothetical protein
VAKKVDYQWWIYNHKNPPLAAFTNEEAIAIEFMPAASTLTPQL